MIQTTTPMHEIYKIFHVFLWIQRWKTPSSIDLMSEGYHSNLSDMIEYSMEISSLLVFLKLSCVTLIAMIFKNGCILHLHMSIPFVQFSAITLLSFHIYWKKMQSKFYLYCFHSQIFGYFLESNINRISNIRILKAYPTETITWEIIDLSINQHILTAPPTCGQSFRKAIELNGRINILLVDIYIRD